MSRTISPLVVCFSIFALLLPVGNVGAAGFTETLPKGVLLLDVNYTYSLINQAWDNEGNLSPIMQPIERYEPGGPKQGEIVPNVEAEVNILVNQIQYGLIDCLTLNIGIPVMLKAKVDPHLSWSPGDYQWNLGRPYSEEDFWEWAASMGQPKPGVWEGNKGTLGEVVLGARYRFSNHFSWFERHGLAAAVTVFGLLPTGQPSDPEELYAVGTTMWDLGVMGDVGAHLSLDKQFGKSLNNRLTLGLDLFWEILIPRELETPRGTKHPLLLNYQPYVGDTYTVDPGDYMGFSFQVDVVPWKGPARATWLTKGSLEEAKKFPPLVTLTFRYTFTHLGQSDWQSNSEIWNWEDREELWRPGYKNILFFQAVVSLLRLGIPLQPYLGYRNLDLLPGKNFRPANYLNFGLKAPLRKFW